jgi:hypothetical protein
MVNKTEDILEPKAFVRLYMHFMLLLSMGSLLERLDEQLSGNIAGPIFVISQLQAALGRHSPL